jgi:DNA repair protein RadA/Sms
LNSFYGNLLKYRMPAKAKTVYTCQKCSAQFPKWMGQCTDCGAWNSLAEETFTPVASGKEQRFVNFSGSDSKAIALENISLAATPRTSTGIEELDRVLGGGVVHGSVVLVGGDPGVGKSTLLLQTLGNLCKNHSTLYVTGEESLQQVAMRAHRLGIAAQKMQLLAETNAEKIIAHAQQQKPETIVIDSIQTINTDLLQSAPGSVSQVRESAAMLVRYAKQTNTALFIIGHVTKDGTIAGPRVLEHMVDCVLYFEGESDNRYRVVRAIKNRFGAVNELGVFAMLENGLREVNNPSAIFLSRHEKPVSGSIITVTWEGSRPLLVELQALVDESYLPNPRRVTLGLEQNRLAMLLAVLNRHGHIKTFNQDVFINIVGGIKVTETAADLPLLLAVVSSLTDRPLASDLIAFGEVGLSGEIRPVQNGQDRLKEAAKHGFKRAIIPKANLPKKLLNDIEIIAVKNLSEAFKSLNI